MLPISVIEHKKADESQVLISYLEIKNTLSSSKLHWKDESSEYEHIHNGSLAIIMIYFRNTELCGYFIEWLIQKCIEFLSCKGTMGLWIIWVFKASGDI